MTLETIYYIGQTIAVFAILGSLMAIYLQQKRTNQYELANGQRDLLNQAKDGLSMAGTDAFTLESIQLGLHDYEALSPLQQARFSGWVYSIFMTIQQSFYLNQVSLVKNDVHQAYIRYAMAVLNTEGGRAWWKSEGEIVLDDEYTEHIESTFKEKGDQYPALYDVVKHYRVQTLKTKRATETVNTAKT